MSSRDSRRTTGVRLLTGALALSLLAACSGDSNEPTPPEVEPSLTLINVFQPVDITPDGSIALLQQLNTTGEFYFYRPANGSLELMGDVGDGQYGQVNALSSDGRVIGRFFTDSIRAGTWTRNTGWQVLPNSEFPAGCDYDVSSAWDITANGGTAVGMLWDACRVAAGRWNALNGNGEMLQRLGANWEPEMPADNRATKVADNGNLIGGWASTAMTGRAPALWRPDGTGFLIEGLAPDVFGEVMAISPDGTMAAGYIGGDAFYWTEAGGVVNIGYLPSETDEAGAIANAIAAGNRLIFGVSGQPFFGTPRAFVWTQAAGIRPLADVVAAAGVTIPEGVTLTNVMAASADGTVVLGQATDAGFNIQSFILRLPVSAYGL